MEPGFWQARWESNQIGFHEGKPNALLVKHLSRLGLAAGARVFVPLCGKTRDIAFLLDQGFRVVGAELSRLAVEQLFDELAVAPEVAAAGPLTRFSAPGLDIFVGDIFDLDAETLGKVDAVYDRAALVALPGPMRASYATHLAGITADAPQLVICFVYDQSLQEGPPFSVPPETVEALYGAAYRLTLVESVEVPGGLKGKCAASEQVWLLDHA
ncbi:thiopurine S-methyltransferase [Xanthobacter autotrophicus DSM 431]|uniref:thiopurine S-methyltransferase n=1 Tax=Xanthobacter nonsaccharivorans TaxID=3119912 RepID=UPI0037292289